MEPELQTGDYEELIVWVIIAVAMILGGTAMAFIKRDNNLGWWALAAGGVIVGLCSWSAVSAGWRLLTFL